VGLGTVPMIIKTMNKPDFLNERDMGTAIWVLSNLARGKPLSPYHLIKEMVPILIEYFVVNICVVV
jgi:hypothetical protein